MGRKSLSVNTKGLAKNLKHGTDHNDTTMKVEPVDNMLASIIKKRKYIEETRGSIEYKPEMYIKFTKNTKVYIDNAIGAGPKKMNEIIMYWENKLIELLIKEK